MSAFKCKMCGGALEIQQGDTVVQCEYCGAKQTLPKLDDEKRVNLYDRANHFRRNNDFDKASAIYEQILNEDGTDSEAYWSLVLCRYGIEYVEDPSSHKRVPTVHRAQYTSIFDDDNYKMALQNADTYQKIIYEQEAKAINEIQKGILAISGKEEPFDVFICYKETDASGKRTHDSVLAQDLYYQLTQEGFKVFFARITLEDKLGSAYEPYIFAALNSAKVMVVLGTKPEFFNAVWVKNEWSRYLSLIKNGAKKTLIPAYRDMDPYDLPEAFSHLQALDMSKLGFMYDLVHGIKKLTDSKDVQPKDHVVQQGIQPHICNDSMLLERAFLLIENGDFNKANEICEYLLNQDFKNSNAYVAKLMIDLGVRSEIDFDNNACLLENNKNYRNAIKFGESSLKTKLEGYEIKSRYNHAKALMTAGGTEDEFKEVAKLFKSISQYKDSSELMTLCLENAESAKKYIEACTLMKKRRLADMQKAADIFSAIPDYKDATDKYEQTNLIIKKIRKTKKILSVSGAIIAAISIITIVVILLNTFLVKRPTVNHIRYELVKDGYTVVQYLGDEKKITVPKTIKGKPVVSISEGAFSNLDFITSVSLPSSVTAIGSKAFYDCDKLSDVDLPAELFSINDSAFYSCDSLKRITIPREVGLIGKYAFGNCENLTFVFLKNPNDWVCGSGLGSNSGTIRAQHAFTHILHEYCNAKKINYDLSNAGTAAYALTDKYQNCAWFKCNY